MNKAAITIVFSLILLGCTQPSPEQAATPAAKAFMGIKLASISSEIPSGWTKGTDDGIDLAYSNGKGASYLFSSIPMDGDTLDVFGGKELNGFDLESKLTPLEISFAQNGKVSKIGGKDWYVGCYSLIDESGTAFEQCTSFTACGDNAGSVLITAGQGKLEALLPGYQHALETFKC
ncbi:MAG: hypothetical protein AABX01_03520 [Candidatus Micrarchaeota archaeon]